VIAASLKPSSPRFGHSSGHGGVGVIGVILIILVVLVLMGRL
jgi:hypothetical protein